MNESAAPAYVVRESARARRVTLRVSPKSGVEVVVPRGFDRALVPDIVAERSGWLRRQVKRLTDQGWDAAPPERPEFLELRALERRVQLAAAHCAGRAPALTPSGPDRLLLAGDLGDEETCRTRVLDWLKNEARLALVPWLRELADGAGLSFERARIRAQKSRWGSCSARGTVSLNCKLLFLPRKLTRHVLLHELAHLAHLNHSPAFWAALERLDPQSKQHDRELGDAWRFVPRWLG